MKYDPTWIPKSWKYCFNHECPLHDECLRFLSALELPANKVWGNAVFPTALVDGECRFFRRNEKVLLATGFVLPDNPVMSAVFVKMRRKLTKYLGGNGTYYLYRNGEKWLRPKHQLGIEKILRQGGYEGEISYAQYREDYDSL